MRLRPWKRFYRLSFRRKILVLETVFYLGIFRLLLLIVPFRVIAKLLERTKQQPQQEITPERLQKHREIAASIKTLSQHVPWKTECLVEALCARQMLAVRRIPNTVYFGVSKTKSDVKAHAWVESGGLILVGASGWEDFTAITKF